MNDNNHTPKCFPKHFRRHLRRRTPCLRKPESAQPRPVIANEHHAAESSSVSTETNRYCFEIIIYNNSNKIKSIEIKSLHRYSDTPFEFKKFPDKFTSCKLSQLIYTADRF